MAISEELARLAALRDQGVLTEQEFELQKAAVLRGEAPANAAPVKGKSKLKMGCLVVAAIVGLLIVIAAVAGGGGGNDVVAPTGAGAASDQATGATEASAGPSLSMDGYNRIKNGMTYEQVVAIIGEPSQEMSRNEMAGTETVMYMWEGGMGANMNAMFQNNKLVQKAQFGLR